MKTYFISLTELLTDNSKTMAALKTRVDSLNSKGEGVDKTVSFIMALPVTYSTPHSAITDYIQLILSMLKWNMQGLMI